jgi:hypothetical protein
LRGEVDCLLSRAALPIDRDTRHRFGQAGGQRRGTGDVAGLGANVVEAAEDDVIDCGRVYVVTANYSLDDVRGHVSGMFGGESAVPLSDCRTDRVDDEGFGHALNLT